MPIVQQFFVDSDSCIVRIAEDDEYITSQELWLKLMVFAIGAVITIICAFEILRSEDSLLLYVFTIVGMLIMIGSLLI